MSLRIFLAFGWLAILGIAFFSHDLAGAQESALVSFPKAKKIISYSIDQSTGQLELESEYTTAGSPAAMCTDREQQLLFAVLKDRNAIASFSIGNSGNLMQLSETIVGEAGSYLSVHPNGKYLFSSYYKAGKVAVHRIDGNGKLSPKPTHFIETEKKAHSVVCDTSGQFVFVSHTAPNAIFQFAFDENSGALTPSAPLKLEREPKSGPRHLWFHPAGKFAFGSDEQGLSVTSYRLKENNGTLETVQTVSSLPKGLTSHSKMKMSTSDIEVHPNGNFVFIANRGQNSIAGFSIDHATGKLTLIGHASADPVPRSFNVAPSGNFLVAAGQMSKTLISYKIDQNGHLKRKETKTVEESPWWIQIIKRNRLNKNETPSTNPKHDA